MASIKLAQTSALRSMLHKGVSVKVPAMPTSPVTAHGGNHQLILKRG